MPAYTNMAIRVYDIEINENDETGVDINSFVNSPAHMRSFEVYDGKAKLNFAITDSEKRIVTGVFILADRLIYREDRQLGVHYVRFKPAVIEKIIIKFFKTDSNKNKNVEHEFKVDGATLIHSYQVHSSDGKYPKTPAILAKQEVTDYSWLGSYYVENDALWEDCKKGIFTGFSVEGYFDKIANKIKTKINMSKKNATKNNFFKNIFGAAEEFFEVTAVDGTKLFYEGDLVAGTVMSIQDADGKNIPAPAGDYQCDVDGKTYAITLDDKGAITAMQEAVAMSETEEAMAAAMKKIVTDATAKFNALEAKFNALEKEMGVMKGDDKFKVVVKKTDTSAAAGGKGSFRNIGKK